MKRIYFVVVLCFLIFVVGCDKTTDNTTTTTTTTEEINVVLEASDGEVIETITVSSTNQNLTLPYQEEEDKIFVGWSDGENIYYPNYTVVNNVTLKAIYEIASEVFDYDVYEDEITIMGYNGNSKYLRIPSTIEGHYVTSIGTKAFYQLDIIEVEIPNTVRNVSILAFNECNALKTIAFYGDFFGEMEGQISKYEFDELILDYSDTCIIDDVESESAWTYQEGCPIKAVTGTSEKVVIGGVEYFQYFVIYDLRFFEGHYLSMIINQQAFYDLPMLERVEFNSRLEIFSSLVFTNTPKLKEIVISEENDNFQVVNNVVYSKDLSVLYFHPNLESITSFTVPETVTRIFPYAFAQNDYIETISVGDYVEEVSYHAFYQAYRLEEIIFASGDSKYFSIDGVLFERADYNSSILLNYPVSKPGSSYVVPDDVVYIAKAAFAYNKNLENVTLNNGLISIGDEAFMYSEKISEIDVPASVDRIGYYAFGRSALEVVIIRRSVVVDGNFTVNLNFGNFEELEIYVPDDSFDEYYDESTWSRFKDFLMRMSEYIEE